MLAYADVCWSQVINIVIVLCVVILICASLAVQLFGLVRSFIDVC